MQYFVLIFPSTILIHLTSKQKKYYMKMLTTQDLHDYANHFNAQISRVRLHIPLEKQLLMPHEYLSQKYPEKYQGEILYPPIFGYRRLYLILEYFNQQTEKTISLFKRLLKIVGDIIYGDSNKFMYAI